MPLFSIIEPYSPVKSLLYNSIMRADTLELLCNPYTGEPFKLVDNMLVGVASGQSFPIRQGIPVIHDPTHHPWRVRWNRFLYDLYALMYDRIMDWSEILKSSSEASIRREYIANLPVASGYKILECATGTASNLLQLPLQGEYYAQDLSWQMLVRGQQKLENAGRSAELFQGDGAFLPFRNQTFDLVFQMGALQFYTDPFKGVSEMARVAKPGAQVHIIDEVRGAIRTLRRLPAHAHHAKGKTIAVKATAVLVPPSMQEIETEILPGGDFYALRFTTPE